MTVKRRDFLRAVLGAGLGATAGGLLPEAKGKARASNRTSTTSMPRQWLSHPPMRPLPIALDHAIDEASRAYFLSPDGHDADNGKSPGRAWRTLAKAAEIVAPGDTVYLRGGIHRQIGSFSKHGAPRNVITVRAYPDELAILDFGHQAFWDDPNTAWEPVPSTDGGVEGEYRSTAQYPSPGVASSARITAGNFGDSMVPLFRYDFLTDLRSQNQYYFAELANNKAHPTGIYCGPGAIWVPTSGGLGRFHIRLSHTTIEGLENNDYLNRGVLNNNYTGETDPRNLQLVICAGLNLTLRGSHTRFQDLVIRGMNRVIIGDQVTNAEVGIEVDGIHMFAGPPPHALILAGADAHMTNCRIRGSSSPWSNRFTEKNRTDHGILAYVQAVTVKIEHTEFTDHHDGVAMTEPNLTVDFHHNLVENMNDDALFLSPRHEIRVVRIWQNAFAGATTYLPFTGGGQGVGSSDEAGCYVFRNFFDLRRSVYGSPPRLAHVDTNVFRKGLLTNEHSNSIRPNVYFYHNDIALLDGRNQDWYMARWGDDFAQATFRVYNNILVQVIDRPRDKVRSVPTGTFVSRNNLLWGLRAGSSGRQPGDIHADPQFVRFTDDWRDGTDLHLRQGSPAVDAGSPLPQEWPDPLRPLDKGAPDIGAIPLDVLGTVFGPHADH